jgi:hypothetical protein
LKRGIKKSPGSSSKNTGAGKNDYNAPNMYKKFLISYKLSFLGEPLLVRLSEHSLIKVTHENPLLQKMRVKHYCLTLLKY